MTAARRLVLVGAGHAHLEVLRQAWRFTERGHGLVLLAPGPFWYSGLATGMLGGRYPPALDRIDVEALALRGGGRFIQDRVTRIDPAARLLHRAAGRPIPYDVLSLNLGSQTPSIPGEAEDPQHCFAVKPIPRLRDLHGALARRLAAGEVPRLVIAGGGATAFEVAGNALGLAQRAGGRLDLAILASSSVLTQLPPGAAQEVEEALVRRGARVLRESRVARVESGAAVTEAGARHPFDLFVNATGLHPRSLPREAGLPVDETGAMIVDAYLRSPADPAIHGGGDGVAVEGHALPKVGVFAIRQAPVLADNLLAALEDREARRFVPQRRYLWVMNLGDGTGLAARGSLWWRGRTAFWLKDWIDRRFLRRYRVG